MKKRNITIGIVIFAALLVFQACIKNYFEFDKISSEMEWNPNLAIPLIDSKLGIADILRDTGEQSFLNEDESNFLTLFFEQDLFSQTSQEFIQINDQYYNEEFRKTDYDLAGGFVNDSVVMTKENVPFPFSVALTQLLDSMIIQSANMRIQVNSTFRHAGKLEITFPSMTLNGEPYKKIITIPSGNANFTYDELFTDFENYFIDLTNFGLTSNSFFINYKLTLYDAGSGNVADINNTAIEIDFTDIDYKFLFGYFGSMEEVFPADSFLISFFENISEANVGLEDPRFILSIDNSFGLPIRVGFNRFTSYSNINQSYTDIVGDSVPSFDASAIPYYITEAEFDPGSGLSSISSSRTFSKTGTNVADVISTLPMRIAYQLAYIINPEELPSAQNNIISDSSMLDVKFTMEIPLFGYAEYAGLQDTFNLDLSGIFSDYFSIKSGLMRFEMLNGLPTEVELQAYFLENLDAPPLDSLISNPDNAIIIEGGMDTNNDNKVDEEKETVTIIDLNEGKMQNIKNTKHIIIRFAIRTDDYQNETDVKFYSDYTINIKMGMQIEGELKLN